MGNLQRLLSQTELVREMHNLQTGEGNFFQVLGTYGTFIGTIYGTGELGTAFFDGTLGPAGGVVGTYWLVGTGGTEGTLYSWGTYGTGTFGYIGTIYSEAGEGTIGTQWQGTIIFNSVQNEPTTANDAKVFMTQLSIAANTAVSFDIFKNAAKVWQGIAPANNSEPFQFYPPLGGGTKIELHIEGGTAGTVAMNIFKI